VHRADYLQVLIFWKSGSLIPLEPSGPLHTCIGKALPLPLLYYFVGVIDVSSVTYLVLDDADCMLKMGLEPQIMEVLFGIPYYNRQTVLMRYANSSWQLLAVIINNCTFSIWHGLIVVAVL
jgi:hypothetical protein